MSELQDYLKEVSNAETWLTRSLGYKGTFSETGRRTAVLLQRVFRGLYHLNSTSLAKVDWSGWGVEFVYDTELATVDWDQLTLMVILAHQMQLRMTIKGAAPGYLRLTFSLRTEREGSIMESCSRIEEVVSRYTADFPALDDIGASNGAVPEVVWS